MSARPILATLALLLAVLLPAPATADGGAPQLAAAQQLSAIQSGRLGIDPGELRCLALNVYFEAGGEPRAGQLAVAWVTINRWVDKQFPRTICGVVKDGGEARFRCQFHWWCDGLPDEPTNPDRWAAAEEAARDALTGRRPDPTGGALYFHNDRVKPGWSRRLTATAQIGNHTFYR